MKINFRGVGAEELSFERNSYTLGTGSSAEEAAELISGWINDIDGITETTARRKDETVSKTDNAELDITADFATVDGKPVATFVQQDFAIPTIDYVIDRDTVADMTGEDYAGQEGLIYAGRQVNNLIVVIPGTVTRNAKSESEYGDAVLFMTHYDSNSSSVGGSGASAVAAMLGTIETVLESEAEYENDLVFLISDGRYEQSVGAYAFKNQFVGFGNIYGRIGAAFNFDSLTAEGNYVANKVESGKINEMAFEGQEAKDFILRETRLTEKTTVGTRIVIFNPNKEIADDITSGKIKDYIRGSS